MIKTKPLLIILVNIVNPILISAVLVSYIWLYIRRFDECYFVLLVLSILLSITVIKGLDLESINKNVWKKAIFVLLLKWILMISLLSLIGFVSKTITYFSQLVLFSWFLTTPVVLISAYCLLRYFLNQRLFPDGHTNTAIIIGFNDLSRKLAYEFKKSPSLGINFLGFFDDRSSDQCLPNYFPERRQQHQVGIIGDIASVAKFVRLNNIKQVYINLPSTSGLRILELLNDLRDTSTSVYFVSDIFLYDLIKVKISTVNDIPIVAVRENPLFGINGIYKRIFDVTISLLILILIAPLMLFIAIGIKLSSPGPVIFKQRRYGLNGKEIIVYKFRTMYVMQGESKFIQVTKNDPRITCFGRFLRKKSLDELPQFFNVLQGNMSIVGPRPHCVNHCNVFRKQVRGYMIRLEGNPGITGLAQIKGFRGETNTREKMIKRVDYDIEYIRNWSIFLDLMIIFKTVGVFINDKNAY